MFEARLAEGALFKKIIDCIKDLCKDINFDVAEDGMTVQAMDNSHVALVALRINPSAFEHYRCDRAQTIGINVDQLSKIFKLCGNNDTVTMVVQDDADVCDFCFENTSSEKVSDFQLRLIDIEAESLGIPEQEYSSVVRMPSKELMSICRDLNTFGDTVLIGVTKEGIKFSVKGSMGSGNVTLKPSADAEMLDDQENKIQKDKTVIKVNEPVELTFALRYLNNFAKASSLTDSVLLSISEEIPLVVEFSLDDAVVDKGFLRFYLAPKLDE